MPEQIKTMTGTLWTGLNSGFTRFMNFVPSFLWSFGLRHYRFCIATNLINILFTGLVASLAIAFGLAFGWGGRHAASDITRTWLNTTRSNSLEAKSGEKTGSEDQLSH